MTPSIRVIALLAALLPALALRAQSTDTPWAAFFGCWMSADSTTFVAKPVTCIAPATENGFAALVVTRRGTETLRDITLLANGERVPREDARCTGWEAASFSEGGARLYIVGESTCGTSPTVRRSGLYAILPNGDLLEAAGFRIDNGERLEVERLRLVPASQLVEPLASEMGSLMRAVEAARLAAAQPLRVDDVIEASARVDAGIAEVWIAESVRRGRDANFRLAAHDLRTLAAAQVPTRVIDVLVAVANPAHFAVAVSEEGAVSAALSPEARVTTAGTGGYGSAWGGYGGRNGLYVNSAQCASMMAAFAAPPFAFTPFPIGANMAIYNCFGNSPFGFSGPFGQLGWWQSGMNRGDYSDYWGRRTVVTVAPTEGGAPVTRGGRVVNGRGYSSSPGTSTSGDGPRAQPREASVRSSTSASSREGSGGSSSGTSSSGESSGRTAKPRTP